MNKGFLYEQLTNALLAELASGLYPAGKRFLSKRKVCARWKISDPTAQTALRRLVEGKLIASRSRSGHYVAPRSQKRAMLLLHRARAPMLPARPGWEIKRIELRRALGLEPAGRKIVVILAALPGSPERIHRLVQASQLRYFECADVIFHAATRRGVALEFFVDNGDPEQRRRITDQVLAARPDGVIAFRRLISYVPLEPMLAPMVDANLGVVTVFDDCEGLNVHSINLNNVAIGYDVARRLLRHGHRRLAVLLPDSSGDYFSDRAVGCEEAWREAGLPTNRLRIERLRLDRPFGAPLAKLLADRSTRPTAIFSTTATFAPELLRTMNRLGISVPGDVSIVMTASAKLVPGMPRPVDTVLIPFPRIGRLAFDTLMSVLGGRTVERSSFVAVSYVAAGTVAVPEKKPHRYCLGLGRDDTFHARCHSLMT